MVYYMFCRLYSTLFPIVVRSERFVIVLSSADHIYTTCRRHARVCLSEVLTKLMLTTVSLVKAKKRELMLKFFEPVL